MELIEKLIYLGFKMFPYNYMKIQKKVLLLFLFLACAIKIPIPVHIWPDGTCGKDEHKILSIGFCWAGSCQCMNCFQNTSMMQVVVHNCQCNQFLWKPKTKLISPLPPPRKHFTVMIISMLQLPLFCLFRKDGAGHLE